MKKSLLLLAVIIIAGSYVAEAQIQKGNVLVGGNLANFDLSLNKGGNFSVDLSPKAAWFIHDNVALGAYLNLGLQTAKGAGTAVDYGVGALGRYYAGAADAPARHTRFFIEANVGIEGVNPHVGDNTNGLGLGIGPGVAYFITPNVGLEGLLKYDGIVGFGTSPTSSHLNLNVGFQVYLPGRTVRNAANNLK